MNLYEKYAKHMYNAVCIYKDTDLDVALYYAIAALDFAEQFGTSTWCDLQKFKDLVQRSYVDLHQDFEDGYNRAVMALESVPDALNSVSYDNHAGSKYSFDDIASLLVNAVDQRGIVNLNILQVESESFILKAHRLAASCLKDRFAAIIPAGYEDDWELVLATYISLNYTGVLIQGKADGNKFYHLCSRDVVDKILRQGIHPSCHDSSSFGSGVVYTYEDIQHFASCDPGKFAVIEITYTGPYLKCMWKQDTDDMYFGECMLYPGFITNIKEASPERKTNLFHSFNS